MFKCHKRVTVEVKSSRKAQPLSDDGTASAQNKRKSRASDFFLLSLFFNKTNISTKPVFKSFKKSTTIRF